MSAVLHACLATAAFTACFNGQSSDVTAWLSNSLANDMHYRAEWRIEGTWESGERMPKGTRFFVGRYVIWRDGNRWKRLAVERQTRFRRGKLDQRETADVYLMDGKRLFSIPVDGKTGAHDGLTVVFRGKPNGSFSPPMRAELYPFVHGWSILSVQPIVQLFAQDQPAPRHDGALVTFQPRSKHGQFTIGFDSRHGHSLALLDERQGPDDVGPDGVRLRDIQESFGGPVEEKRSRHEVKSFRKVNDRDYPSEWLYTEFTKMPDSEPVSYTKVVRLIDLAIGSVTSDADFDPNLIIKRGTPVTVMEDPTVAHHWDNGQVVRSVDQGLASQAIRFEREPGLGRRWWVIAGIVALAAVASAFFMRRRRLAS